eukprot:4670857-Prymnesium_polylepis.2
MAVFCLNDHAMPAVRGGTHAPRVRGARSSFREAICEKRGVWKFSRKFNIWYGTQTDSAPPAGHKVH